MDANDLLDTARRGHTDPETEAQRLRTLGDVETYSLSRESVPIKGGKLELEFEPVELTGRMTHKKEYWVYVKIGDSANLTALPATGPQECSKIMQRLRNGEYNLHIENGILGLELQPTQ